MKEALKIGFIGGGNMASSLIGGLVSNACPPSNVMVSDLDQNKLSYLKTTFNVQTTLNSDDVVRHADVLVLSVKPQSMKSVAQSLSAMVQQHQPVVVSIAAGINLEALTEWLGGNVALVRCMPNTPALVQTGATGLYANTLVNTEQRDNVESLLRAVGVTVWVRDEGELDAVTAVSGSGPAYFFLVMEAIEAAAKEAGLDEKTARLLTQETALGAAKMALESAESAGVLRERVTSPNGTTERALNVMESQNLRETFKAAVLAAKERSIELSKELGES